MKKVRQKAATIDLNLVMKHGNNQNVNTGIRPNICNAMSCDTNDIMETLPDA
ncbi:MAG: XRE family transcriptional regulator [Clostridia bacterium]